MDETVKRLIFEVVMSRVVSALLTAVPFLNLPIIKQIVTAVIMKIAERIWDVLARVVDFKIIDIQTAEQARAYEEAVQKLKDTQANPEATLEQVQAAQDAFKARMRDLIRLPR